MNQIFIKKKCKKCDLKVSLTGKHPTHCGIVALLLKDTKLCKAKIYKTQKRISYGCAGEDIFD